MKLINDVPTDIPGIYKSSNGSIINKDNDALKMYKLKKQKDKKINDLENAISDLRNDMQEIKELLRGLAK